MFFQVTGAFAELEWAMIRSRVNAGLARARARGVRLGRPKVSGKTEATIPAQLANGEGMLKVLKVSKTLGVGVSTVVRVQREMKQIPVRGNDESLAASGSGRRHHRRAT